MPNTYQSTPAATVEDYLKALPPKVRTALRQLRNSIKEAAPNAEEKISYQMPGYKYLGPLVFFAAFKSHCSLFAVSRSILTTLEKELQPFEVVNTTIHFTPENPLPSSVVQKIVRLRIKENEERKAGQKLKSDPSKSRG